MPTFELFCWLGSRAPGASILYPQKCARTQPEKNVSFFGSGNPVSWSEALSPQEKAPQTGQIYQS